MIKKPVVLIFTILMWGFLSSCQVLPNFFDAIAPEIQDGIPSPTTPLEVTATALAETQFVVTSTALTDTPQVGTTPVQPTTTVIQPMQVLTPTPVLISSFIVQEQMPIYLPNFAHLSAGCDWMGVAGQVFDSDGQEIQDLTIMLGNTLTAEEQIIAARTGLAPAYGPGGYEIQIADKTFDSSNSIWVQVINPAGQAVSTKFFFDTFDDCSRNLILINFIPENNSSQAP